MFILFVYNIKKENIILINCSEIHHNIYGSNYILFCLKFKKLFHILYYLIVYKKYEYEMNEKIKIN